MVVPTVLITIVSCDELAALATKVIVTPLLNLLSSRRHGNVTETPTLAGV
jgi:hypothetical protein